MVHVAADGVVNRVQVSNAPVMLNQQIRDVARATTDLVEKLPSLPRIFSLLVNRGLEVMEQVKLFVVDNAGWQFVVDAIAVRIGAIVGNRRGFYLVQRAIQHHAGGVTTRPPALAAIRSGSAASRPISLRNAPTRNSRMEIVLPSAKNGRTRRSLFTPLTCVVSTLPSGLAVIEPNETPLAS